jgi:hypothetical protein
MKFLVFSYKNKSGESSSKMVNFNNVFLRFEDTYKGNLPGKEYLIYIEDFNNKYYLNKFISNEAKKELNQKLINFKINSYENFFYLDEEINE